MNKQPKSPVIIMGIDPGLVSTGLGMIAVEDNRTWLIGGEVITTRSSDPLVERLGKIHREVSEALERRRPDAAAVESLFFAKNVRSAVLLAHARAAAIVAAAHRNIQVYEYSPLEIKQAVAGFGRAGKEQIQRMVRVLLGQSRDWMVNEHVSDALACALCHAHQLNRMIPKTTEAVRGERGETSLSPAKLLLAQSFRRSRRRRR